MSRSIELSRQEAESLVDLLFLTDDPQLIVLDDDIRRAFGMQTRERELGYRRVTVQQIVNGWIANRSFY